MYILGISAFYHDSAACLLKNGDIIAAAQEERFTRKKHDSAFPLQAIRYCLAEAGITKNDLTAIAFYEKPFLKFERIILNVLEHAPFGFLLFARALPQWLKQKLWIPQLIRKQLLLNKNIPIYFTEHHEAHAASAFFPSPFENSAVLTIDGVGEFATSSIGTGKQNKVSLLKELHYPNSLGLLYSAFTYYLGFKVNSDEYKVMGLAPYGKAAYVQKIYDELIALKEDGSFSLNKKYFNFMTGLTMTNKRFAKLFNCRRRKPQQELTQQHKDIARSIQDVTEEIMLRMARHAKTLTKQNNLCIAGGVGLNCAGNGRIIQKQIFKNVWIQPAASDAGGALGAALFTYYLIYNNKRNIKEPDSMNSALLGPAFTERAIEDYLLEQQISYEKVKDKKELYQKIAQALANQKIVGWFHGRMEYGPRALGSRSILADPRSSGMKDLLNSKIKFREAFRPFGPVVLEEAVQKYFECTTPNPYMLVTVGVKKSTIPAVTHVNNTARLQTVSKKSNIALYNLLKEFEKITAVPVLINTSFNVRGEPIVCTPEDAYNCFLQSGIDILVLENFVIKK